MAVKPLPSRDLVRQLLRYDPDTGKLIWLHRPREMFSEERTFLKWNRHYAGTVAGNARTYIFVGMQGTLYSAHRLIWLLVRGEPVPTEIDHIDGNPYNNLIVNLRAATRSQNVANTGRRIDNISGVKGIRKQGGGGFVARIKADGRSIYLGSFATIEEAARVRQEAAAKLHGEFARHD